MIVVTGLNKKAFAVNPDLIERMHESPDTTLIMLDGSTHIIQESMRDTIEMIAGYRARVLAMARDIQPIAAPPGGRTSLSVVPQPDNHAR